MALDLQNEKDTLAEMLARMKELYDEGHVEEAGKKLADIFSTIVNDLAGIAGVEADNGDDSYVKIISALNDCGFITESETEKLTKFRKIRNNFIHYVDIQKGNDEEKKGYLEKDIKNFKKHIAFTEGCIDWFCEKAENPVFFEEDDSPGFFDDDNGPVFSGDYESPVFFAETPAVNEAFAYAKSVTKTKKGFSGFSLADSRLFTCLPAVFCTVVGFALYIFFKQETLNYLEKALHGNETPVIIGFLIFLTTMFVLFFEVSFPAAAGVALAIMTKKITGSDVASLLACMTSVFITVGYSDRLRKTMGKVTFSIVTFVCLFIAKDLMGKSLTDKGVVLDRYNTVTKIVLPIVVFIAIAVVLRLTVAKNFRLLGGFIEDGTKGHMLLAVIPAAILGFMYRSTWINGIALLSRNFYDSKLLFWTIHIVLILALLRLYDELVLREIIRPVNLLVLGLKICGLALLLFLYCLPGRTYYYRYHDYYYDDWF
ncbi:MAG: hypothetical protein J5864_08350 [Oscillospiraceae bacterium]|nr:hypothetical protein [Oscillospiraceae bacterium]